MNRRTFLKASGVTLGLPWFESLANEARSGDTPQRLLLFCLPLGLYRDAIIPSETGAGYQTSEYLSIIDEFRDHFTICSGLEHPDVNGGHSAEARIFTGVPSNKRNVRSLDQYLAGKIGSQTRFDSLPLSAGRNIFSWTDGGTMVPAESKMSQVYARLFVDEGGANAEKMLREIGHGKSITDLIRRQAEALQPSLSDSDQNKLEEYFESVRETERRLVKSESWVHTPKPTVDVPMPQDPASSAEIVTQMRNVCDMIHLAFKTDSTRVITSGWFQQNNVNIQGVSNGYHPLSHHGMDPNNIGQLKLIEKAFFEELKILLTNLINDREGDRTLLDRTTIVVTSNLGNASNHSNKDLPVLLIGGNYDHGQHLAFEPGTEPLSNLYLSVLNQFGFADKEFGSSTGPLKGLEFS
ncbi:MAG: DUF1552 domain-containing protein [Verrucomicrobiae bacterium]|nr:DUF1552 domain-containing protein [Verrucomicrobiae bacterium]